jgi:hypothetical protein
MRNLITDVPGLRVGHAQDARLGSGSTAIVLDAPAVAAVDVRGGAPGTRETDLLDPGMLVEHIDAIALSGGSAFGLDAASGVQAWLREQGRGFAVGPARVPIVPGAILFDLTHAGDKTWGRFPPYRDFGYAAAGSAPPPAASRAASARPRHRSTASPSAPSRPPMRPAAWWSATVPGSGLRRSSRERSSAAAGSPPRSRLERSSRAPRARCAPTPRWWSSRPTPR